MSRVRRNWLIAEMASLYLLAPLGVYALVYGLRLPLFAVLPPLCVVVVLWLDRDPAFSWRELLRTWLSRAEAGRILGLFVVLGGALIGFAYLLEPDRFLAFPRRMTEAWLAVLVLYPLVSVSTQEIIYRVFFQHRYGVIFAGNRTGLVLANAALFAFSHVIFESWVAVGISFVGGLIFAYRYVSTRSFWSVVLEHSLYGNLIFTSGLGRHFFTGVPLPI